MADPQPTYFSQVAETFRTTNDQSQRAAALDAGVLTAKARAHRLYQDTLLKKGPATNIRVRYEREAGLSPGVLPENPFMYVPQSEFEEAYRSWASSGGTGLVPWELLGVSVREGWTTRSPLGANQAVTTAQSARTLWRSRFYYQKMGLDHFIDHRPTSGDNQASFLERDAAGHQRVFEANANGIEHGLAQRIDAELYVTPNPSGGFDVRPTPRFYELSLRLTDAYFRENRDKVEGRDFGLGYMRWNLGETRYNNFDTAALRYSRLYENRKPNGAALTEAEWAFKTPVISGEWDHPRINAIHVEYFAEVFRVAYEDVEW